MVSINSDEENQFLSDKFVSEVGGRRWIGAKKTGSQWSWSDGTLWAFENWCSSGENCGQQPSGDGDCVDLGYHNLNTWNDFFAMNQKIVNYLQI